MGLTDGLLDGLVVGSTIGIAEGLAVVGSVDGVAVMEFGTLTTPRARAAG